MPPAIGSPSRMVHSTAARPPPCTLLGRMIADAAQALLTASASIADAGVAMRRHDQVRSPSAISLATTSFGIGLHDHLDPGGLGGPRPPAGLRRRADHDPDDVDPMLAQHVQGGHAEMAGADEGDPHGGCSVLSRANLGPSITRRRLLSRRANRGQGVINRGRHRLPRRGKLASRGRAGRHRRVGLVQGLSSGGVRRQRRTASQPRENGEAKACGAGENRSRGRWRGRLRAEQALVSATSSRRRRGAMKIPTLMTPNSAVTASNMATILRPSANDLTAEVTTQSKEFREKLNFEILMMILCNTLASR